MNLNEFIRNEWQPASVGVLEAQQHYVTVSGAKCFMRQTNDVVMLTLAFKLQLTATSIPSDFAHIDVVVSSPPPLELVRVSAVLPHVDAETLDDSLDAVLYSTAMIEFSDDILRCRAFPFEPGRRYDVNTQLFYRVL